MNIESLIEIIANTKNKNDALALTGLITSLVKEYDQQTAISLGIPLEEFYSLREGKKRRVHRYIKPLLCVVLSVIAFTIGAVTTFAYIHWHQPQLHQTETGKVIVSYMDMEALHGGTIPHYIPKGFDLLDAVSNGGDVILTYVNTEDRSLNLLYQSFAGAGAMVLADTTATEPEKMLISNLEVHLYELSDGQMYAAVLDMRGNHSCIIGHIERQELLRMLESIGLYE